MAIVTGHFFLVGVHSDVLFLECCLAEYFFSPLSYVFCSLAKDEGVHLVSHIISSLSLFSLPLSSSVSTMLVFLVVLSRSVQCLLVGLPKCEWFLPSYSS